MKIHQIVIYWRKYAPSPILTLQILSSLFLPNFITGCIISLWLTVPCSMNIVNKNWYLWYPRQLIFATFSILYMFIIK